MVSIIIINYNTAALTAQCVASIKNHEKSKDIEYIVVDNASNSDDYNALASELEIYSDVRLIKSNSNLGFAAGNMLGYQFAKGDYIAFINSDVVFVEAVFDKLIAFLKKHSDAGVCGPQILDEDLNESISFRHFEGIRYKLFGKKFLEMTQPNKPSMRKKYSQPTAVDFVIGSFMMFKKEAFNTIGGFDINTFLYYEESDVCYRMLQKGYKTYFMPNTKYIHLEGKSSNENLHLKLEHLISYLYITRKNMGFYKYFIIKSFLILNYALKAPFKAKNRFIFKNLITMGESLSLSLRHKQKIIS